MLFYSTNPRCPFLADSSTPLTSSDPDGIILDSLAAVSLICKWSPPGPRCSPRSSKADWHSAPCRMEDVPLPLGDFHLVMSLGFNQRSSTRDSQRCALHKDTPVLTILADGSCSASNSIFHFSLLSHHGAHSLPPKLQNPEDPFLFPHLQLRALHPITFQAHYPLPPRLPLLFL